MSKRNIVAESPVTITGKGSFTPPPAPCGGADCGSVCVKDVP